jgi:hypothetical protein
MLGGCYTYQPVDGPIPVGAETVRVELTGAGQDALRERQGIILGRVEGRILDNGGDELTIQARLPANLLAFSEEAVVDTLSILQPHIRTVDVKQFSRGRTALGVAGGLAGGALLYYLVDVAVSSDGGGSGEGGGNVQISVMPWIDGILRLLR